MHVLFDYEACSCVFVIYLMHEELKNIRIIELELFERTRRAIRRRLRRDESHYVRSEWVIELSGSRGRRAWGDAPARKVSRAPPAKPDETLAGPDGVRRFRRRQTRLRGPSITRRRAGEHGLVRAAGGDRGPSPESAVARTTGAVARPRVAKAPPNPNPNPRNLVAKPWRRRTKSSHASRGSCWFSRGSPEQWEIAGKAAASAAFLDDKRRRDIAANSPRREEEARRAIARLSGGCRAAFSPLRRESPEDAFKSSSCRFVPTSNRKILTKDYFNDYLIL